MNIYRKLYDKDLITEKQFTFLEAIRTAKIVSLYSELRLLLYLGIILFTTGVGYFAYENLGSIGHILLMFIIAASIIACFAFIGKHAKPYSSEKAEVKHIYYDYIVLLSALLIISLFTYIQIYFELVELLLNWTSFISSVLFFFMAYRYDNRGVLTIAITLLAAAFGLSVSPINWVHGDWVAVSQLYFIGMLLGSFLLVAGHLSQSKAIKSHFQFSYQNFGLLLLYAACISAVFDSEYSILIAVLTSTITALIAYRSWNKKEFLFFLYSSITGYITFTYLFFRLVESSDGILLMLYYVPLSCIGFIVFLINKKSHFSDDK